MFPLLFKDQMIVVIAPLASQVFISFSIFPSVTGEHVLEIAKSHSYDL